MDWIDWRDAVEKTPVTLGMIVLCCLAFLLTMFAAEGDGLSVLWDPPGQLLIRLGANYGPLTYERQEYWRLASCMFFHVGILHLLFNMNCLYVFGQRVEQIFGSCLFLVIYLCGGVIASLCSGIFHYHSICCGASGAIFASVGAYAAWMVANKNFLPRSALSSLGRSLLIFLAVNLFYGMMREGVDLAAHAGGLLSGFLLGYAAEKWIWRGRIFLVLLVACGMVLVLWPHGNRFRNPRMDFLISFQENTEIYNRQLNELREASSAKKLTNPMLAERMRNEILPPLDRILASGERMLRKKKADPKLNQVIEAIRAHRQACQQIADAIETQSAEKLDAAMAEFDRTLELLNQIIAQGF